MAVGETMADNAYNEDYLAQFDSVEVSLLTCSPHEEIYSLYGHSALRWHDLRAERNVDVEDSPTSSSSRNTSMWAAA